MKSLHLTVNRPFEGVAKSLKNGAPERIRTSDPQIRSQGALLFLFGFFVNRPPDPPRLISHLP